ncbi:MAG: ankyrin repeat domain-containing protein [Wolbachia sp.]
MDYYEKSYNATGKDGKTPLYLAYNIGSGDIRYQNQDIVKILLQKGAEVDATILHLVIQHSSTDIVKAIIDKGVDINETDKQEKTPLHWTIFKNKKDVVKLLLEAEKIDVNEKDKDGNTPLHLAIVCDKKNVIELLLKAEKIDINAIDGQGRTPLYWAVVFYCTDATKVLIQKTLIQDFSVQKPDYLTGAFSTYWDKCKNEIEGKGSVNDGSTLKNKNDSKTIQRKSSVTNSELSGSKPTSEQKNNTQGNDKRPGSSSKNAQKNKWLTVAAPATLAIAGVVSGIAIAVYLEMLAVGIAVGACCLVAAAIIYYCNEPSNSLEDSNAEAAE